MAKRVDSRRKPVLPVENQSDTKVNHISSPAKRLGGPLSIGAIIARCLPRIQVKPTVSEQLSVGLILCLSCCLFLWLRDQPTKPLNV